jgi:hypothetical protein
MPLDPSMDLMLEFEEMRTDFSDEAYAAIGRGLAFATRFESNCRALAAMNALKSLVSEKAPGPKPVDFDEVIARVTEEYWNVRRLRHHAQSVTFAYDLSTNARRVVQAARKARNVLAHEFTLGVSHELASDQGRAKILSQLAELTAQIADGDRLVALIMHLENGDPAPTAKHFESYVARAVAWVCEVAA